MERTVGATEASAECDPSAPDSHRRLQSIADLLGCDAEAVASGSARSTEGDRLGQATEMLRLWLAIPDAHDRGRVLALARDLATT